MKKLNHIQGISFPRSGHHFLINQLCKYFKDVYGGELPDPGASFMKIGPFTYCEYYRHCMSNPCSANAVYQKNHDLSGDLLILDNVSYIVQYRHPVPSIISEFERKGCEEYSWMKFSSTEANRWCSFVKKWLLSSSNFNKFSIYYDDLVQDTRSIIGTVLEMMGEDVDESLIMEHSNIKRKNIEEYNVKHILNITANCRKDLDIPDELPKLNYS